ncbi:LysR family transcriptional regulator [Virgibacillus phasianinus]|uniref:LysR family transcriptional regulator n=1 Tax=Virgibacillus phasianinus TaxID=2017483 RepID=A0A220U6V2_9BACI|nr:LysR family transcriptional regulator [Virgibacillus phasianinus]ASK63775.1 LysR family transcriptional regulator [Virgibacillus phasianinus]
MDIRQLTYFVEVVKQKNFTKASQTLLVSQPSISKMIKGLEEELKVTLLDRSERKLKLTDAGQLVYEKALRVLRSVEDVYASVDELVNLQKGTVKMALMPTIGVLLFPTILAGFKKKYPRIDIQLVEYSAKYLELQVEQGDVDIGVTALPVNSEVFETVSLLSEELVLIVDSDHWLADMGSVRLSDLKNESFILFTEDYLLHDMVRRACLQSGFEPKVAYKSSLWDLIGEMVASQLGISLIPRSMVSRFSNLEVREITLSNPHIDWELALIYRKDKYLSYATHEFVSYVKKNNHP